MHLAVIKPVFKVHDEVMFTIYIIRHNTCDASLLYLTARYNSNLSPSRNAERLCAYNAY